MASPVLYELDLWLEVGGLLMFYGQCNACGERWGLGTAPTCRCEEVGGRMSKHSEGNIGIGDGKLVLSKSNVTGIYTTQPEQKPVREWQGLTDEEVGMLTVFDGLHHVEVPLLADFARAIEAKLKEKNHG